MLKFQGFLTFGLLLLSGCHCSLVVAASSEKISLFSKCKDRLALKCMLSKGLDQVFYVFFLVEMKVYN